MESIKINKIEDTKTVNPATTAPNAVEPSVNEAKGKDGVFESPAASTSNSGGGDKVHVTYIANGIWTDSTGQAWSREAKGRSISDKTFTVNEYDKRDDIHYMVKHGLMKKIQL